MTLGMLSAISLMCMDGAMAARPLPVAEPNEEAVVEIQAVVPSQKLALLVQEPVVGESTAAEEIVSAGEEVLPDLVFGDENDETVAERLISYIEGLDTLKGDFTQIAASGAISTGQFYLRRPGFLRFEYEPPTPLLIVANRGLVYVRDDALETTDSYPVGKTPLKFLLQKKIDRDEAEILSVDRGVDTIAVTFGSDEETEGELTIIASAPEMVLERWIIRDVQNGITVVTLENVESGIKLANRLFRVPESGGQFLKN